MRSSSRYSTAFLALIPLFCLFACSGCDAINSVNKDKTEDVVPVPAAPAPVTPTPPPMTPEAAPVVKTPQQIIEEFLAKPNSEKRDEDLKQVAELPEGLDTITTLDLSRSGISDEGAKHLTAFPKLTVLNLAETRVSNAGLVSVGEVNSLQSLTLASQRGVDDLGINNLKPLNELESLTITSCPLTDGVLATLAEFESIQVLNLSGCSSLLGKEFVQLSSKGAFRNLRELQVSGTGFGNYGLDQLNKLPHLEVLRASNCGMAGATIKGLTGCDELKILDLSGNAFFDDNMKIVSRLKNLEELRLGQIVGLTDECLNSLKVMKQLKVLDMEGTRVTEAAVLLLKEKFLKETEIHAVGKTF